MTKIAQKSFNFKFLQKVNPLMMFIRNKATENKPQPSNCCMSAGSGAASNAHFSHILHSLPIQHNARPCQRCMILCNTYSSTRNLWNIRLLKPTKDNLPSRRCNNLWTQILRDGNLFNSQFLNADLKTCSKKLWKVRLKILVSHWRKKVHVQNWCRSNLNYPEI